MALAQITPDQPAAAKANREALDAATGAVALPAGKLYLDSAPVLSKANAGTLLAGNGTTLANSDQSNNWVTGRALAVRPGGIDGTAVLSFYEPKPKEMPRNQVGWLFNGNGSDGHGFYPDKVIRVGPGEKVPESRLPHFMRAHHGVPFTGSQALNVPKAHGFRVGDDVFATDGPLINEVLPEFRKITATGAPDSIMLNKPLTRRYTQGSLVGGPIPKALTFQGLRFIGVWGPVLIQQSVDVTFADDTFDQCNEWVAIIGSARITFTNCTMPSGLQSSASHDVRLYGCAIREIQGEQGACDFLFEYCRIGHLDTKGQCTGWKLRYNVTTGPLLIYDDWLVDNHVAYGPVIVRGRNAVVRDLWSAQPVQTEAGYQGAPLQSATGIVLDNITAPAIHCGRGTSGVIRRTTCPVLGDTSGWKVTP